MRGRGAVSPTEKFEINLTSDFVISSNKQYKKRVFRFLGSRFLYFHPWYIVKLWLCYSFLLFIPLFRVMHQVCLCCLNHCYQTNRQTSHRLLALASKIHFFSLNCSFLLAFLFV